MAEVSESVRNGAFILSEGEGSISRDAITIAANSGALSAGTVLAHVDDSTATAAAIVGTGNATCSAVVVDGAEPGVYTAVAIAATKMLFLAPNNTVLGIINTGVEADLGGLTFTVTAGLTAMVAGDYIEITVEDGDLTYGPFIGSNPAAGILYASCPNSTSDQLAVMISRIAEVKASALVWDDSNDSDTKASAEATLLAKHVIFRS